MPKMFHVVVVNDKTGAETVMTATPCTHDEACTIKSKINHDHKWRTVKIQPV